jgi:hypothetical protein
MKTELLQLEKEFERHREIYRKYLPKVDPRLVQDLLEREQENHQLPPMYIIEVFRKPVIDQLAMKNFLMRQTGMVPAVCDQGTHYAIYARLTLGAIQEISDLENVLEVTGEYIGSTAGVGASHEPTERADKRDPTSENNDQIKYENCKIVHEHDLVPIEFNGVNYSLRCITCGMYFCQLCGKAGLHDSHYGIPACRKTKKLLNILKSFQCFY